MSIQKNYYTYATIYIVLPIIIFLATWLHWYIGIPAAVLLIGATIVFLNEISTETINIGKWMGGKECIIAFAITLLFVLLTGHGSFIGAVGCDTPWRNSMYNDLITQPWPVIYDYSQSALIYYLTYWIVPACVSAVFKLDALGRNVILVTWTFCGICLFLEMLWDYLHLHKSQLIYISLIFLFWSGLNIVMYPILAWIQNLGLWVFHLNTGWGWEFTGVVHGGSFLIRTTFESIANIYNQFVPLMLGTILFLRFRNIKSCFFLSALMLPYSPFGFVGMVVLSCAEVYKQGLSCTNLRVFLSKVFSKINLFPIISICIIFALYYFSNTMSGQSRNNLENAVANSNGIYIITKMLSLFLYYISQFAVFLLLIYKDCKDKILLKTSTICLIVFPFIKIGTSSDFLWNASIPAFYILMVFVMQKLISLDYSKCTNALKHYRQLLIVVLLIAIATPVCQLLTQLNICYVNKSVVVDLPQEGMETYTFADKDRERISEKFKNFTNINYQDTFFYKYLAKNK